MVYKGPDCPPMGVANNTSSLTTKRNTLTAGQLEQQSSAIEKLIHYYEGFKFLRVLRGSPPYFEKAKKDIFARFKIYYYALVFQKIHNGHFN